MMKKLNGCVRICNVSILTTSDRSKEFEVFNTHRMNAKSHIRYDVVKKIDQVLRAN